MDNTDTLTSSQERGLEIAKSFVNKLIMPAIEETGLLLKDQVTMWKFRNQIKILNKAKLICEKHNISTKTISLKLLCPLLDYSGLEEDEVLQDKWAVLLSNMVDSNQNIENHVFPYILSQLSSGEFLVLEKVYDEKVFRTNKITIELREFRELRPKLELELQEKLNEIETKILELNKASKKSYHADMWELSKDKRLIEGQKHYIKHKESSLNYRLHKPESVPIDSLKQFELSNVIRLGLVKEEKEFYANSQTLEIPLGKDDGYGSAKSYANVDIDIEVESSTDYILTELGELFISACKEKQSINSN